MVPRLSSDGETQSELILNALANIPHGSISIFDKDMRCLLAAGKGWTEAALDPQDLIGKTPTEAFSEESFAQIESYYQKVLAGEDVVFDLPFHDHWYSFSAAPVFDEDHKVIGIIVIALNSDERKLAEAELARSEAKFRTVFQSVQDAILLVDDDGHYIEANPAACELIGVPPEEVLLLSIVDIAPVEFRHRVLPEWKRFLSEGRMRGEFELSRPDGERRFVEYNAAANFLPGQHLSVLRDITEHKKAERTQSYFASLIESTDDAIIGANLDWIITSWNGGAEKMLGYSANELIGQPFELLVPIANREESKRLKAEQATTRKNRVIEKPLTHKDGREVQASIHSTLVGDTAGNSQGVFIVARDITERMRAEEMQARLATIVENSNEAIISKTLDGIITTWNKGAERIYGHTAEEAIGRHMSVLLPPDRQNEEKKILERLKLGEHIPTFETRHVRREGHIIDVAKSSSPIFNASGEIIGASSITRDISERKQAESALRASEERFQGMVANVPGMVYQFALNPDGSVAWPYISEGCREIFGMAPESYQAAPTQSLESIFPEDRISFDTSIADSARTLEPWKWEGRHYFPTGETRWIEAASRPQRLPNGGTMWNGVVMDITIRKQAEEKLAQSAAVLQATFEATADGILVVNNDGEMTHYNQQFVTMWGIPDDIIASRDNDRTLDFLKGQLVNSQEFEDSSREYPSNAEREGFDLLYFVDGRVFERYSKPLELAGKSIGRVWSFRDIAERQSALQQQAQLNLELEKMQVTLEQANEELEERVIARTRELEYAVEEASAARVEAEQANHAKNEFLSRMSHELRTPMNAILGFGQILEMRDLAPKEEASVQQILKAGRHLLHLINEVLEISRIESGGLSLSIEPTGVLPVLREALDLMQPLAEQRRITLINQTEPPTEEAPPGGWFVMADRQRLRQVMLNLLSNAIKYNREDGEVVVSLQVVSGNNCSRTDYLKIMVRDTGPGISVQDQKKLFIPFERLGAEKTATEGTGIGLPLAQRLAELMRGYLGVESSPGRGSTFWVELPIAQNPAPSLPHDSSQSASALSLLSINRPLTFLYIEDNASNLGVMETLLEETPQVRLLTAIQGSIGLDLARQHQPDLILLDLHLPDIQGDEVLQRLQSDPATSQIPVVMVSADATSKQIEKLRAAGAKGYVTKPFEIQQLISLIEHIFKEGS